MEVSLRNIVKSYDQTQVVHGIDLDIVDKEFVVLVGPSGCGKSTTLRMIAGLEGITSGELKIGDNVVNDVSPGKRGVAMVFQDYALYPHMSVYENMAFSLRLKNTPEDQISSAVAEAARMLDLSDYLDRKPAALSGGQRQRVAMGRAVVKKAGVFLFDEPLSNLDAKLRSKMRGEIKRFHQKSKTTTVYVTHDQLEAMTLADKLVVMKDGHIEQVGTPLEVYDFPHSTFVATFIGHPAMNLIEVDVVAEGEKYFLKTSDGHLSFVVPGNKLEEVKKYQKLILGVRPSDIYLTHDHEKFSAWQTTGTVDLVEILGKNAFITFKVGKNDCTGEVMGRHNVKLGDKADLTFNLDHAHFFDPSTSKNILLS